jgi:hypothetical protein
MMSQTHPYRVAAYNEGATVPIRTFEGCKTESDAQGFADHLTAQAKQHGWTLRFRIEKEQPHGPTPP